MDFTPDLHIEDVKSILSKHKNRFVVILDLMFKFLLYIQLEVGTSFFNICNSCCRFMLIHGEHNFLSGSLCTDVEL